MRTYTFGIAIALLVLAAACGVDEEEGAVMGSEIDAASPSTGEQAVHSVCGSGSTVFGIDVSVYQGTINWSSVKSAGVKYAFIRVADGANYIDSKFATNWAGAKQHGVLRGAYQFFRSNQDPTTQANVFLQHLGTLQPGDLPPVVDVETTDGVSSATRAARLHTWLTKVQAATGVTPIIYTGGYFWDDNVGVNDSQYPLWHAGYTGGTCPSTVSNHWSHWTFWQYTSSGHVNGISGNVDLDRFNGTMTQLAAMEKGGTVSPPPPPPPPPGPTVDELEAIFGAAQFDAPGNSDIDGDGAADMCARAAAGLVCSLSHGDATTSPRTTSPIALDFATTSFADANGWSDMTNYATLRIGDVTGDGKADVCARANAGIVCKPSAGDHFGANISGPALSDAEGWNKPEYYSTIRVVDVDGDGKADVCARAALGFMCWLANADGNGFASTPIAGGFFKDTDGFLTPDKYGTIRMADIDGDGKLDVCARSASGVECHRFVDATTGFGPKIVGPAWSDAHGFNKVQYWSTLRFADLDGDGRADVCVRASDAIHCRLSTGTAFSADDIVGPALSDASGWGDDDNYATLRFGDIDGDGRADLCGRANARADCWKFDGVGFSGTAIAGPTFFADAGGFTAPEEYRTIRLADVDGDGRADLCGRDSAGFSCFLSSGDAFATRVDGPRYSNAEGWNKLEYSGTFLLSGASAPLTTAHETSATADAPPSRLDPTGSGTLTMRDEPASTGDDGHETGGTGSEKSTTIAVVEGCSSTTAPSTWLAFAAIAIGFSARRSRSRSSSRDL